MKLPAREAHELLDTAETVLDQITGTSRWHIHRRAVIRHDGKLYEAHFRVGATEMQDDDDDGDVTFTEVFPYEKTITEYSPHG